jgi:hypothetical protein
VLSLRPGETDVMPLDAWAQLIRRGLSSGRVAFLAAQLAKRRFRLRMADLPALGLQLLEEMDRTDGESAPPGESHRERPSAPARRRSGNSQPSGAAATTEPADCSTEPGPTSPQLLEKLEHLDDLVYEAIHGADGAMEQLRAAWPRLLQELDENLLFQSREQYLRYALSVWDQCSQLDGIRHVSCAIQATEVLCLLFDETDSSQAQR